MTVFSLFLLGAFNLSNNSTPFSTINFDDTWRFRTYAYYSYIPSGGYLPDEIGQLGHAIIG
jgi:hypothetical protein